MLGADDGLCSQVAASAALVLAVCCVTPSLRLSLCVGGGVQAAVAQLTRGNAFVRKYCALLLGTAACGTATNNSLRAVLTQCDVVPVGEQPECIAAVRDAQAVKALMQALADASDDVVLAAVVGLQDACKRRTNLFLLENDNDTRMANY